MLVGRAPNSGAGSAAARAWLLLRPLIVWRARTEAVLSPVTLLQSSAGGQYGGLTRVST